MPNRIMLDLETMGTRKNSAIIAIGAVRFDKTITDQFYEVVTLESSVTAGMEMDPSTVMWWMRQSDDARAQFNSDKAVTLQAALQKFDVWIGQDAEVWGNGAAFDNVILAYAYECIHKPAPWAFWNDRCYRTVKNLNLDVQLPFRESVHHHALDDAEYQAIHLMDIERSAK